MQGIELGDVLEGNNTFFVLIIGDVLQAPAVDVTGTYPFLQRMADRYNKVPTSSSRVMRDKLKEQGLNKLLEDSAGGPMKGFNSCKYTGK